MLDLTERITLLETSTGKPVPVRPGVPALSSAKHFWKNLRVENHVIAPAETPAVRFHDFGICLEVNRATSANELRRKSLTNKFGQTPCEICVVPPLTEFKAQFMDGHSEMLYLHFNPAFIERVADKNADSDLREVTPRLGGFDATLQQLALIIQRELAADCPNGSLFAESIQTAFAVYVLQNYSTTRLQTSIKGGLTPRCLRLVLDYINANLEEDLRVNDIAALAGKSDYHFTRLFKQSTGLPVYRYVQEQRIKLAQRLLADRNLTVTEIAYRAGFASHSRFTELFRRLIGLTPTAYRNNL